jgi:hypothetical protein
MVHATTSRERVMKSTLGLLVLALPFVCIADVIVPAHEKGTTDFVSAD